MKITEAFGFNKNYISAERITSGHINDTYKILYSENEKYILQRVNDKIFKNPEKIMHNIKLLNNAFCGADKIKIPCYIESDGKNYIISNDSLWRMCPFINQTVSFNKFDNVRLCQGFGSILGIFHKLTSGMNTFDYHETISGFHNTAAIIERLFDYGAPIMHSDVLKHAVKYSKTLMSAQKQQIVHNDAKCSNILFYKYSLEPAAIIDLDTVMPGLTAYDIGDAVRSSCTDGSEINTDKFIEFIKGYIRGYGSINAQCCIYGTICITAELASRYIYDFLSGENYFKFQSGRMKLERFRELVLLAEHIEIRADELINIAETLNRQLGENI